jgi:hypothetical protein
MCESLIDYRYMYMVAFQQRIWITSWELLVCLLAEYLPLQTKGGDLLQKRKSCAKHPVYHHHQREEHC